MIASLKPSVARNVISNWGVTAAAIVYSLVITPIVISALNREMYGVWTFLNGLLAYADLLYLGAGAALVKDIARHTVLADQLAVNRMASVVLSILTAIGLGCFLIMAGLSPFIPNLLGAPLSAEVVRAASYTCILLGVQLLCFFATSTYIGVLIGHDRFDLVNLAKFAALGIRVVLVSLAVQTSNPLLGLAVFMTIAVATDFVVLWGLAYRVSPGLRLRPALPTRAELRHIYSFGAQSFLIQLSSKLISYTDVTVIAMTLGASAVSLYVLPLQLIEYLRVALGGISGVLLPRLTGMATLGDLPALRAAYLQSARLVSLLAAFLITNLTWLGAPFLTVWVGPEFGESARWIIVYLAGATLFHVFNSIVALPFYQAMGVMAVPAKVLILEALVNLALSVALVRTAGIDGVALATIIPAFFVSFLILPRYLCGKLALPVATMLTRALAPAAAVAASVAGVHWLIAEQLPATSYPTLVLRTLATVPLAALLTLASLTPDEREWLATTLAALRRLRVR